MPLSLSYVLYHIGEENERVFSKKGKNICFTHIYEMGFVQSFTKGLPYPPI
jgi:hypothetical protein